MDIHHIFIFTDEGPAAADPLVAFGLTEGSGRVHEGQGTANRKFYFEDFFLEILWVHDEAELRSPQTAPMGLWKRATYRESGYSPFGLCLVHSPESDAVFRDAYAYQPAYFPPGHPIDLLRHEDAPGLPWTFRLPFPGPPATAHEPRHHPRGLQRLTQAAFSCPGPHVATPLDRLGTSPSFSLLPAAAPWLTLTFDDGRQGQEQVFEALGLTLLY